MTTSLDPFKGLLTVDFLIGLKRFTFPNWKNDGRVGETTIGLTAVGGAGTGFGVGVGGVTTTGGFGDVGGTPAGGFAGCDVGGGGGGGKTSPP